MAAHARKRAIQRAARAAVPPTLAAVAAYDAACAAYRAAVTAYRAREIGDAEFLAARALRVAADQAFDVAYAAEQKRARRPTRRPFRA